VVLVICGTLCLVLPVEAIVAGGSGEGKAAGRAFCAEARDERRLEDRVDSR
jgi:threonine aldolase